MTKSEVIQARRYLTVLYTITTDTDALGYIFNILENALREFNLLLVDAILEHFNPKRVNTAVATGILRVTSRAKTRLPSWITCLCKVKKILIKRGEDADHLLRGLVLQKQ